MALNISPENITESGNSMKIYSDIQLFFFSNDIPLFSFSLKCDDFAFKKQDFSEQLKSFQTKKTYSGQCLFVIFLPNNRKRIFCRPRETLSTFRETGDNKTRARLQTARSVNL